MESRILVVDDEKEIRGFLSKALSRMGGFQVDLAESGEEAIQKMEKEPFDLVLTDLKMPKMDGLQLISEAGSLVRRRVGVVSAMARHVPNRDGFGGHVPGRTDASESLDRA